MPLVSASCLSAVAIRHVPFEDLGLLGPILTETGWSVSYREAAIDDLGDPAIEAADLLVVLGGPIGVYEAEAFPFLTREIALIERRLRRGFPTLGICLGSQLMAKALGGRVFAGPVKEIGWGRLELTEAGAKSCLKPLAAADARVLHWHGDTFDLPAQAVRLAGSAHYENQAFACGRGCLALQFHLEAEPRGLEQWFVGHAAELAAAGVSIPQLRAETAAIHEQLHRRSRRIFRDWVAQVTARSSELLLR
jgi:GMP synthase (glutamine-hydrolysing)